MACEDTRQDMIDELADLEEQLTEVKAAYKASVTGDHESYRKSFPGGASQRVDRRSSEEIRKEMEYIRARISLLKRKLGGCANPAFNLRRRRGWW
jgi:hypothetical protein